MGPYECGLCSICFPVLFLQNRSVHTWRSKKGILAILIHLVRLLRVPFSSFSSQVYRSHPSPIALLLLLSNRGKLSLLILEVIFHNRNRIFHFLCVPLSWDLLLHAIIIN